MNVTESNKISVIDGDNDYKDKTIEKSLCSRKLNKTRDNLTSNAKQTFTELREAFTKPLIF